MTDSSHKQAPTPLRLVQLFLNTADLEDGTDDLASTPALAEWLVGHDLAPRGTTVTRAELARALDVREGLRASLDTHSARQADPAALERLERAAARAPLRTTFGEGGPRLEAAVDGVDAAMARLLAIATAAAVDGSWRRLKACADPSCRWAFFDHSKNRSGRWCDMASCGNQHKAQAFRERGRASRG